MFCRNCGKINPDDKKRCMYCGAYLSNSKNDAEQIHKGLSHASSRPQSNYSNYSNYSSKKTAGLLLGFFLGLIGLIIGLCIFDGYQRETFLSGWLLAFFIELSISVILFCFMFGCATCSGFIR